MNISERSCCNCKYYSTLSSKKPCHDCMENTNDYVTYWESDKETKQPPQIKLKTKESTMKAKKPTKRKKQTIYFKPTCNNTTLETGNDGNVYINEQDMLEHTSDGNVIYTLKVVAVQRAQRYIELEDIEESEE